MDARGREVPNASGDAAIPTARTASAAKNVAVIVWETTRTVRPRDLADPAFRADSSHASVDAARALRDRISWKVATGLPLDSEGFDYSVLTYWRSRLRRSEQPERIFDAVHEVVGATGVLQGRTHGPSTQPSSTTPLPPRTRSLS